MEIPGGDEDDEVGLKVRKWRRKIKEETMTKKSSPLRGGAGCGERRLKW